MQALEPCQVEPCKGDGPDGMRTCLGWCLVGPISGKTEGGLGELKMYQMMVHIFGTTSSPLHSHTSYLNLNLTRAVSWLVLLVLKDNHMTKVLRLSLSNSEGWFLSNRIMLLSSLFDFFV